MATNQAPEVNELTVPRKTGIVPTKKQNKPQNNDEIDPKEYYKNRLYAISKLQENKTEAYPHKFNATHNIGDIIETYSVDSGPNHVKIGDRLKESVVAVAGRVMLKRESGKKLVFYDICGDGKRIQLMSDLGTWESDSSFELHREIKRGDIVGAEGFIGRSKSGELSIFPKRMQLLAPCLHMIPTSHSGLKDQETRFRQRYLDLIINPHVRETFERRSMIIQYIRDFLHKRHFIEVETPMLNKIPGGAVARPFVTYHNELKQELYMRIAPELYLKELVIGGMDRVFEIGKNFRNEGMDLTHNPEFTCCEFYMAYADFYDIMNITEEMISGLVFKIFGSYKIGYQNRNININIMESNEVIIDFSPPWKRISMMEEISFITGETIENLLSSSDLLKSILTKYSIICETPQTIQRMLDKMCGHFIESIIVNPTFITEHPQVMSPLAKWHRSKSGLTERFEAFIAGKEICNAYTELNDPIKQLKTFEEQAIAKAQGDNEASDVNKEFVTALEYGLPPTGGWGLGIDRLVMFLTNNSSIKEVILFPAMKPEVLKEKVERERESG